MVDIFKHIHSYTYFILNFFYLKKLKDESIEASYLDTKLGEKRYSVPLSEIVLGWFIYLCPGGELPNGQAFLLAGEAGHHNQTIMLQTLFVLFGHQ